MPLTLNELTTALEEGSTTSVQLTEQALARATDPAGEGARAYTRLYAESALAQARASDTLRAAGVVRSAVEGLPVSIRTCSTSGRNHHGRLGGARRRACR